MNTPTDQETSPEFTDEQLEKVSEQENRFKEAQQTLDACIAFWKKHRMTILRFCPDPMYGWAGEIGFPAYANDPKDVARAFGAEGWTRRGSPYSCGSIDWTKTVDGIKIIISGAEKAPDLRPEVKLPPA